MCSIGAVVVTYNRLEKLKAALLSYEIQTYKPKYIMVIDNHSTDGTDEFLRSWEKTENEIEHRALHMKKNIGGSGGFYEGMKAALEMEADWVWIADDDAYPEKTCFCTFMEYMRAYKVTDVAAFCAAVYTGGKVDIWHRRRFEKRFGVVMTERRIREEEYAQERFELDLFSYVGTLISKTVIKNAGLPKKDFFISYDDSEHSIRIGQQGKIICLPAAKVIHDTQEVDEVVTWKKYYGLRNKIYSYDIHFGKFQSKLLMIYYYFKNYQNIVLKQMTVEAIHDASKGKLGVSDVYKPGWKENVM